jgi:hypothetical protein
MVSGRGLSLIETVLCEEQVAPEEKVDILFTPIIYREHDIPPFTRYRY